MPGGIGDIVVTAGIDSRQWYEEAGRLGQSAKQLGGKIHEGLRGPGSGQLALDAFSSGLKGGIQGVTSTVAGAIETYGASFGKLGAGIGVVAGVGFTALISSLAEQKTGFDDVSASIETARTRLDAYIERTERMARFDAGVGKLAGADAFSGASSELDARARSASTLDKTLLTESGKLDTEIREAEKGLGLVKMNPVISGIRRTFGFDVPEDDAKRKVERLDSEKARIDARRADNAATIREIDESRRKLFSEKEAIESRGRDLEAKRISDADSIFSAREKFGSIAGLVAEGKLGPEVGARATRDALSRLQNTVPSVSSAPNDAAIGGTAGGFSALQAALRAARGEGGDPELRELIQLGERQVRALEKLAEESGVEDF